MLGYAFLHYFQSLLLIVLFYLFEVKKGFLGSYSKVEKKRRYSSFIVCGTLNIGFHVCNFVIFILFNFLHSVLFWFVLFLF